MILLVRVNWNAWLDGDKTFDIVEQPLSPTSNNSRVRMVKKFYGRNKSCCKFVMVAYGKVKIENKLFQHLFLKTLFICQKKKNLSKNIYLTLFSSTVVLQIKELWAMSLRFS